jgi:hypothetical protein
LPGQQPCRTRIDAGAGFAIRGETLEAGPPPGLLFDLAVDPFEEHDRASEEPERAQRMGEALDRWFESVERDRAMAAGGGLG